MTLPDTKNVPGRAFDYSNIPLRCSDGRVVAFVLVDTDDYWWLAQHRWRLDRGYAMRTTWVKGVGQRVLRMHREILGLEHGNPLTGDHINRNRLDNRRSNLRVLTRAEQRHNVSPKGASGIRGVVQCGRRWQAYCRSTYLGTFDTADEASAVARAYRLEHLAYAID